MPFPHFLDAFQTKTAEAEVPICGFSSQLLNWMLKVSVGRQQHCGPQGLFSLVPQHLPSCVGTEPWEIKRYDASEGRWEVTLNHMTLWWRYIRSPCFIWSPAAAGLGWHGSCLAVLCVCFLYPKWGVLVSDSPSVCPKIDLICRYSSGWSFENLLVFSFLAFWYISSFLGSCRV